MKLSPKQLVIILFVCIAALGAAMFVYLLPKKANKIQPVVPAPVATTTPEKQEETKTGEPIDVTLGQSVQGRKIEAYTYGKGQTQLVFVAGIHGGYEWNTELLAYKFIDYLAEKPESIPDSLSITVVPVLNPDGVFKTIGKEGRFTVADVPAGSGAAGRLNAHSVDLNRNFDCNWQANGVWQDKAVSGGTSAFSEPESAAIKNFVLKSKPAAVIFWHSKSGTVYGSSCNSNMLAKTVEMMDSYSKAASYNAAPTFNQYAVSGDATDWLSSIGIPAITVELKTHESIEWDQNLAGIKSLFKYFGNKK